MKKFVLKPIVIFGIIIIALTSCTVIKVINTVNPFLSMSSKEEQQIKDKASKTVIDYFKNEKNLDVVITEAEFSGETGGGTIFIEGHFLNNKQKKISASVYWKQDYTIGHPTHD
ncbi:hypothetical protein AT269_17425 [Bacillus cereus]|uniref:hypothetical protein n=1 Tax=Bacillus cereus group TaxID=86661 RepID=UPI0002798C32|nr:hypothetical protein [Bacillus mycoides]EJS10662.1 hypothetical protein IKO_00452 [Bacillus cereus VDM034]EJS12276.1 hypothetical protein IKS_04738 [Bacillus cereus VDM062]KXY35719.1 hypothetical protein AT269_17425 [Bacillus cereus]MBG9685571.1 hypothetical protein [Bacillus mycoides]QWI20748.1 hypothetical protein EXW34_05145 [Bacillus mycoides]